MTDGTIITSFKDAIAVGSKILESAENEIAWVAPRSSLAYALQYNVIEKFKMRIQSGVSVRGIVDFSYASIDILQKLLAAGQDVRHFDGYQGIFMVVADKESISSINIGFKNLSLDTPVVALWSNDPTYAEYLTSTFETAWQQAVPAAQRIEELLKEGPPNI
jgi:sugar-specific transcriptional regulator TrmB